MIQQIIAGLKNKIKTLIQRFSVTATYPVRTGEYPRVGGSFMGVSAGKPGADGRPAKATADIEALFPYGLIAALPLTATAGVKFNVTGDSSNRVGIAYDPNTLPNLEIGEVAAGAFSADIPTYLKFTKQGAIEIHKVKVIVSLDLTALIDALRLHTHTGGTLGGGLTGPPSPPLPP